MSTPDAAFLVFDSHAAAESAIRTLGQSGFDMQKLSLVGKGYHSEEKPMGFYTAGDRIKAWGGTGAFWGGIWGLLLAPAVFVLPGLGVVGMAGPFVATLIGALEGAVVVGGLSALGAALTQVGVPKDQVIKYEAALKVDKYLLVMHGSPDDLQKARTVLAQADTTDAAHKQAPARAPRIDAVRHLYGGIRNRWGVCRVAATGSCGLAP
ncbi:MAG: DUF1269 domain-containing protein [Leptothrix sp. (in: b-proteobacteria)]